MLCGLIEDTAAMIALVMIKTTIISGTMAIANGGVVINTSVNVSAIAATSMAAAKRKRLLPQQFPPAH